MDISGDYVSRNQPPLQTCIGPVLAQQAGGKRDFCGFEVGRLRSRLILPRQRLRAMHTSQMSSYLLILPVALLVTYSQLMVKWRSGSLPPQSSLSGQLSAIFTDPLILSAYAAAFFASIGWLLVVAKLPLTIAFPVYIGVIFIMVFAGGYFILGESMSVAKFVAAALILSGIVLGMSAHT